jgi:hypothetical protein
MKAIRLGGLVVLAFALADFWGCGGNDDGGGGTEADYHGVGAACASNDDCFETGQSCLPFKGGYCGIENCTADADCPGGSRCVTLNGTNYCFLVCVDKIDCNRNRPVDFESNCSSNIVYVDGKKGDKACIPPS